MNPDANTSRPDRRSPRLKLCVLICVAILLALGLTSDALTLENLAAKESTLRDHRATHPAIAAGIAFLIYVITTGLSLPGATILTLAIAWLFGFWQSLLLVSFASTAGATLAFLLSRFLLHDTLQRKYGKRLRGFNEALRREGAFYLFTLRLIPAVPFFMINLVMGLTPLRTKTFWWVSQVGMLPGTAVYVYAGSQFPSLQTLADKGGTGILTPQLISAFVLLGIFPIAVKKILSRFKRTALPPTSVNLPAVESSLPSPL